MLSDTEWTVSLFRMPIVPRFDYTGATNYVAAWMTGIALAVFGVGIMVGWLTAAMLQFMALVLMGGA